MEAGYYGPIFFIIHQEFLHDPCGGYQKNVEAFYAPVTCFALYLGV
jgi:hypothetical protein